MTNIGWVITTVNMSGKQEIYEEANKRHVRLINGDEFKKSWKTSALNTISEGLNGDNSYGDESKRLY